MNRVLFIVAILALNAETLNGQSKKDREPRLDLKTEGAFGFPQKTATVLCDTRELRVSVYNDREYLFVQAILWTDENSEVGETDDGRKISDWSNLAMDANADGKATAERDRNYSLNPWPSLPGLHYAVVMSESASTGLTKDSKGRGSIQYVNSTDGKKVRVDSYLIPLEEIGRKPGKKIRFAYWASSAKPELVVNSVGFESERKYYAHSLPRESHHELTLADRPAVLDPDRVPEGRNTIAVASKKKPTAEGREPPEVAAEKWFNWSGDASPTLRNLRGKVVVVEFWATWCGPCVAGIPHLNKLHEKHKKDGVVILSLTDQSARAIEKFVKDKDMKFTVGAGSETADEYGVTGIPHAFVVGRDGKLIWHGHPSGDELDEKIEEAIKTGKSP